MSAGAAFASLAKTIRGLTFIPDKVAEACAAPLNALIQAGFSGGTDPYGAGWAPLKPATIAKGRFPPPLTDSGALRGAIQLTPFRGAGLRLANLFGPSYGAIHMTGSANMAARQFFPVRGLPAAWRAVIQAETSKAFKKALGK